jgi:hypothetical protein
MRTGNDTECGFGRAEQRANREGAGLEPGAGGLDCGDAPLPIRTRAITLRPATAHGTTLTAARTRKRLKVCGAKPTQATTLPAGKGLVTTRARACTVPRRRGRSATRTPALRRAWIVGSWATPTRAIELRGTMATLIPTGTATLTTTTPRPAVGANGVAAGGKAPTSPARLPGPTAAGTARAGTIGATGQAASTGRAGDSRSAQVVGIAFEAPVAAGGPDFMVAVLAGLGEDKTRQDRP